jgi:hypothetical protein
MLVRVTDLCGRDAPYVTDSANLPDGIEDILYELSCDVDGPWFIGEIQYDEVEEEGAP